MLHERALRRLREQIRRCQYVVTLHAEEEMSQEGLCVYDLERAILTGRILERQKDGLTGESKYRVRGQTTAGADMEAIAKFGPTGKVVIITAYLT